MLSSFAPCVLARLIIYISELIYLLNRSNPHPFGLNYSKAINIDKIAAGLYSISAAVYILSA